MSAPRDNHLTYLTRRLDIKERELTIREREIAFDEARLELEREKFAWLQEQQAQGLGSLHDLLEHVAGHAVDDDELPVARNSRGRA